MLNRKAIAPYVSVVLLLFFSVTTFSYMYDWLVTENDQVQSLLTEEDVKRALGVDKIEGSSIFVQNDANQNITLDDISIGGVNCNVGEQTLVPGVNEIDIGSCTQSLDALNVYDVALFTNAGVATENEYIFSVASDGFFVTFDIGTCNFASGYIKVFGLSGLNNSHLENASSSEYTYSACVRHENYTLGTLSSGTFVNLGYLVNESNSGFFTSTSAPLVPVSTWHNISLSSSGGTFDLNITTVSLESSDYLCLGKFDRDNTYGAHFGDCYSSHNTTIWLKLS